MEYVYENPKTGERKTVVQGMNEEHVYEEDGIRWNRVFEPPQFSIGDRLDPWSAQSFQEYTGKRKGKLGDLWELSGELSEKRAAQNGGVDPVKEKYQAQAS